MLLSLFEADVAAAVSQCLKTQVDYVTSGAYRLYINMGLQHLTLKTTDVWGKYEHNVCGFVLMWADVGLCWFAF